MIGKNISHYRILERLGEGGMGIVYKAQDTRLQRTVATKVLKPEAIGDSEAKERFIREARAASALNHPNITTIHEIDEWQGQHFIVMEYVEGKTLREKVKSDLLPMDEVLDIATQTAEALKEAHDNDLIHRDIKSENIMVTEKGQVKVMDFGLAKLKGMKTLTKTGSTMGTVAYMSPEQAKGKEVDHRTDIWSFGVVLYEMITGQLPFYSDYEQALIYSILNEQPVPMTRLRVGIPKELERIVNKALTKKLDERYQHVVEMLVELKPDTDAVQYRKAKKWLTKPGRVKNKRILSFVLITTLLILLMVAGYYLLMGPKKKITSIAVLPLQNLSGDSAQEYFVDGIHDELIAGLAKIKALIVISRTSVMQYKDAKKSLPEIARELNVDAVVEGTVRRTDDQVRITVNLIDAKKDRHLLAKSYERSITNILGIQNEVAQAVAREIKVAIAPEEERHLASTRQVNPDAYEAYLQGVYFLEKSQWKQAMLHFQRVIDIDPGYAPAYAGLARVSMWTALNYPEERIQALEKARQAAQKAMELDGSLASGHEALGEIYLLFDFDWSNAETEITRALELNPSYGDAHNIYSSYLAMIGQYNRSIEEAERSVQLNPFSVTAYEALVWAYFYDGQYNRAIEKGLLADKLVPGASLQALCYAYAAAGRYEESIATAKQLQTITLPWDVLDQFAKAHWLALLGGAYALSGQRETAFEMLSMVQEMASQHYVSPYSFTYIYACLGMKDQVFEWFERACQDRNPRTLWNLPIMKTSPIFDFVRSNPRFHNLLRLINLPE